jgi:ureidoglycolate amidohydrolase
MLRPQIEGGMALNIDRERLVSELENLGSLSDNQPPALTRVVFGEADRKARAWLASLCREAQLAVRYDPIGNMFARWTGSRPELPAIGTGSHIDAIPHSGKFDGTVGVLGGLEAIRALRKSGFQPERSIELLMFTAEEPTRFGIGCFGSRLLSGALDGSADQRLKDPDGLTLAELRSSAGYSGSIEQVRLPKDYYAGFVELHIEQGPLLEKEKIPIGIVTHIAAPAGLRISVEGEGGHAGAVLMPGRKDAFCAAAEIVLAVEQSASTTGAIDTCGTVGKCQIYPGAVNSIPSRALLEADIRDTDEERRNRVLKKIEEACTQVSAKRGVTVQVETINADAPAQCSRKIIETLAESASELNLPHKKMVSRAYHDSLFMARIAPVAMIFIPCRGGFSHRPDEYASPQDIEAGTRVLASTLAKLSSASA